MINFSISNQLPIFLATNGTGLNNGKVYIGQPNQDPQTFPKTVYWDEAGTDPVDQTNGIPTIGGYITRAGSPATIYVSGYYSIRVLDRFGSQVYYFPEVVDLAPALAAPDGADLIGAGETTVGAIIEGSCFPEYFGVVDDPNHGDPALRIDQAVALQEWLTYSVANRLSPTCSRPIRAYSSVSLSLGYTGFGKRPDIRLGNLDLFVGATPGLTIGNVNATVDSCSIWPPNIQRSSIAWAGDPETTMLGGLVLINVRYCSIYPATIRSFPVGIHWWSENQNALYNNTYGGALIDNRFAVALTTVGVASAINENKWFGGMVSYSSASIPQSTPLSAGFYFCAGTNGYAGHNDNHVWGFSFEMPSTVSHPSITEGVPVYFDGVGGSNSFEKCRAEGWSGPLMHVAGNINGNANATSGLHNTIDFGVIIGIGTGGYVGVRQVLGAYGNKMTFVDQDLDILWNSGDLRKTLYSGGGANACRLSSPFFFREGIDQTNLRQGTGPSANLAATNAYGVQWMNGGHFIQIDTGKIKTFEFFAETQQGFPGRWFFQALDAAFTPMSATSTDSFGTQRNIKFSGATTESLYGGGWGTGGDFARPVTVTVTDAVKYLVVGKVSGTGSLLMSSFGFHAYGNIESAFGVSAEGGNLLIDPLFDEEVNRLASANPGTAGTHGLYGRGMIIGNNGAASGGTQPMGWQCTLGGALGAARVNTTAYPVPGQVLLAGSNAYFVRIPGTTGAVAPTGTTPDTDYADGTVTWRYLGPKATFAALANIP